MGEKLNTYADGFSITCENDITQSQFMEMCGVLTSRLKEKIQDEADKLVMKIMPEPITEGGFFYTGGSYDEKATDIGKYKCMRIRKVYSKPHDWPWINNTTVEMDWKHSETVLYTKNCKMDTFLKAFNQSPRWTIPELKIVKDVMSAYGMKCKNMPKAKTLIHSEIKSD